jgi:hypothetical protein
MARIDAIDKLFLGIGTWDERTLFKNVGFQWNRFYKAWVTPDPEVAQRIRGLRWTDRAWDLLDEIKAVNDASVEMSYAADTVFEPPCPEGLKYLGYQKAGIEYSLDRKDTLLADQPGLGKMSSVDTPVLTPTGWRAIGTLAVGDLVYSVDGRPTKVTGVFPQGVQPNYKVTFRDGTSTNCGLDHLWAVSSPVRRRRALKEGRQEFIVKSLGELMAGGLCSSKPGNRVGAKWYIPLTSPVEHPQRDLPVDPYILGVLLGNGYLHGSSVVISSPDISIEVTDEVTRRLPAGFSLTEKRDAACPSYIIKGNAHKQNHINRYVKDVGLGVRSREKFIPQEFFLCSIEQRIDLLRGLMDTDGSAKDNRITYHTTSRRLATDVADLVRSLGGVAIERWYDRSQEGKPEECQVNVRLTFCPFLLTRKAKGWWPSEKYPPIRYIISAEYVGDVEQVCISVEHPSKLYVVENYIVTHNTIQAIGVSNCLRVLRPRTLVVCPASLKENWRREFVKWTTKDISVGIAETQHREKFQDGVYKNGKPRFKTVVHSEYWPDTDVVIINYEIVSRFLGQIHDVHWNLAVYDEAHALKTPDSLRTIYILGGGFQRNKKEKKQWYNAIEAKRRMFLSGTPMLNRPVEMWNFVRACDPAGLGKNWENFTDRYCGGHQGFHGRDVSGCTNSAELGQKLRESFMVRRLKREVLPDLPPKIRGVIALDTPEIRDLVAREDELAQALRLYENLANPDSGGDDIVDTMAAYGMKYDIDEEASWTRRIDLEYAAAVLGLEPPAVSILFEELAKVRRELGLAKLSGALPWLKNTLDGGEKLLVFAYHSDVVEALFDGLKAYKPALIYGKTPVRKRQAQVDYFQENDGCRVFIGNIDAAGVGLTLTKASDVAFIELDWVPSKQIQCEDRACRIGSTAEKIFCSYLVANGSLDARIAQSSYMKEEVISSVLDT